MTLQWAFLKYKKRRLKSYDPRIVIPWTQIEAWILLYMEADSDYREVTTVCWHKMLSKLQDASTRWMRVIGPLSATISTLLDMQGKPAHPCRWIPGGSSDYVDFAEHPHISDHRMLHLVENSLTQKVWADVADTGIQAGFEEGIPDFEAVNEA